jgi:hypothetical protein
MEALGDAGSGAFLYESSSKRLYVIAWSTMGNRNIYSLSESLPSQS